MSSPADRRFFVHAPHDAVGVASGIASWQPLVDPRSFLPKPLGDTRTKLCLVSACPSHQSDQSLAALGGFLEQHYDVARTESFARSRTDLPGLEQLGQTECVVLFAQRLAIVGEQLEQLRAYFASGRPVVAILPPGPAFAHWPEWEAEVLGITSTGRACQPHGATIETAPFADGHPVLRDVSPMRHAGGVTTVEEGTHTTALLTARTEERVDPVAWVRSHDDSRSFFTTLGQPTDFQSPAFLQLLAGAVLWTTRTYVPA